MIKNTNKEAIIKPLLLGLLCLALGGGLLLYYYKFAQDKSTASFVISYLVVAAGGIFFIYTIYAAIMQYLKAKTLMVGEDITLEYVSHQSISSTKNQTFYKIKFKFDLNGQKEYESKSEFLWIHVLTFKAVGQIKAKVYKNIIVINEDIEQIYLNNKDSIKEIEKKYHEAYTQVDNLLK